MKKLGYRELDGAVSACARFEADAVEDFDKSGQEDQDRATDAKLALIEAARIVRGGGVVLVLTKAELRELRKAFGNSVGDPDWYAHQARNRNALLSAAEKLGETVGRWDGRRPKSTR